MSEEIVGGQAIIEGVMMLNGKNQGIAVRNPKGKIITRKKQIKFPKSKLLNIPIIRGIFKLFYMLSIGIKALNFSADVAIGEENKKQKQDLSVILLLIFSLSFAILLFKFLPLLITKFIVNHSAFFQSLNILPNILDGMIKISFFIGYVYLMSKFKDTKTLFEYHGAEHKTIRCYESKKELTVKNVKAQSRFHPRCGTSFIFGVFLISILIYTLIPFNETTFLQNFTLRILLLPLIAGISYEVLKISGKNENNIFFRVITAPGLWMQRITTKEPNNKQIEVGIKSLKITLK